MSTQFITSPTGERLVVLAEEDYEALAEQAGIAPAYLSQVETGKRDGTVETLGKLADGHSYQTADDEMSVSINTVRTYIRTIYEKLHVHTRSAAVAQALRSGLI